jgi:hypothetical protein
MRVCLATLMILAIGCPAAAQVPDKAAPSAFATLIGRCEGTPAVIEGERKRLGARIEAELLAYLGKDVEKHYWIGGCISSCYQPGDRALQSLALLIEQQALSLLRGTGDEASLDKAVGLHVFAAVQSERLGFHGLAISHKTQAEALVAENPILDGGYPAMSADGWKTYQSLPKQPSAT